MKYKGVQDEVQWSTKKLMYTRDSQFEHEHVLKRGFEGVKEADDGGVLQRS